MSTKPEEPITASRVLPFVFGLLLTVLGSVIAMERSKVADLRGDIEAIKTRQAMIEMRENDMKNGLANVLAAQDREHKLVVLIARKMGIVVVD